MEKTMIGFPVPNRMEDINKLAMVLRDAGLGGDWHFVHGSRYDQECIDVEFDRAEDGEKAWHRYQRGQGGAAVYPRSPL